VKISNNTPQKFIRSKIFNPFHGGRALGAVYGLDNVNVYETAILIFIGSKHDFHDDTQILARVSRKEICRETKISMPTFCRSIKSLIEKNYLYIENNYDDNGLQVENTYYISDFLFYKYAELKGVNLREYHTETPGVSHREIYNTSVAISPIDPCFPPERSDIEEKNKNKNNELNLRGSQAEGEGLSLQQNGIEMREEIPDSPTANTARESKDELNELFVDDVKVSSQFSRKISQAKIDNPELKALRVTESHRKMVMMFRPDPKIKSFVRDNDIYFMTDEIIGRYGQQSHAIITQLFTFFSDNGKCGQMAWNVNAVWELIEAAKKTLEKG
jgi:hypothetical protein